MAIKSIFKSLKSRLRLIIVLGLLSTVGCLEDESSIEEVLTESVISQFVVEVEDAVVFEEDNSSTSGSIAVRMDPAPKKDTMLFFSTVPITAETSDYTLLTQSAFVSADQDLVYAYFEIKGDIKYEDDEVFVFTVLDTPGIDEQKSRLTAEILITEDDDPPTVSIGDASITEGGELSFPIELSDSAEVDLELLYTTIELTNVDSASPILDFTQALGRSFIIPPGVQSTFLTVQSAFDTRDEFDESFLVSLTPKTDGFVATTAVAEGVIIDDDPLPIANFSPTNLVTQEHSDPISIDISLTPVSGRDVTVAFQTEATSTAVLGQDYSAYQAVITIPKGETLGSFTLTTLDDFDPEAPETLRIVIDESQSLYIEAGTQSIVNVDIEESDVLPTDLSDLINKKMGIRISGSRFNGEAREAYGSADLNGDGYEDIMIYEAGTRRTHVVYGGDFGDINITLSANEGEYDYGYTWNSFWRELPHGYIGDVNGDGYDDTLGDRAANYLILGAPTVSVATDSPGFSPRIAGHKCTAVGDINGDGLADLNCLFRGVNGVSNGISYFLYGRTDFTSYQYSYSVPPGPSFGIVLTCAGGHLCADTGARALGDINGDGYDDVLLWRGFDTNNARIWFGRKDTVGPIDMDNIEAFGGANGNLGGNLSLRLNSLENPYDHDNDGIYDFFWTKASSFFFFLGDTVASWNNYLDSPASHYTEIVTDTELSLNNSEGGAIRRNFNAITALDIDLDGYQDLSFFERFDSAGDQKGEVEIYFGSSANPTSNADISSLPGSELHRMIGEDIGNNIFSVSKGDFNGDGADDLIVGVDEHSLLQSNSGSIYVIWGGDVNGKVDFRGDDSDDTLVGTTGVDRFFGKGGEDTIMTSGGFDVVYAGSGDDRIVLQDSNFHLVQGNRGHDTIEWQGTNLDFSSIGFTRVFNIDAFDLVTSSSAQTLKLTSLHLTKMNKIDPAFPAEIRVFVRGSAADTLDLSDDEAGSWSTATTENHGGVNYRKYNHNHSIAKLFVEVGMGVTLP